MNEFDIIVIFLIVCGLIYLLSLLYRKRKEWKKNQPSAYVDGLNALIRGDKNKALEKFREAAKDDTNNVDAYLKFGDVLREKGTSKQAIKLHRNLNLRSGLKPFQKIDILHSLALDYQSDGQLDKAIETVDEMIKMDRSDIRTYEMKLELTEQNKNWDGAFQTFRKIQQLKQQPESADKLAGYKVFEGLDLVEKNEEREARICFKKAIKIDASCAHAYLYLGDSYIRENNEKDALVFWKQLVENNPSQAHLAFKRLEKFLFEQGAFNDIENIYLTILKVEPHNENATVSLAELYSKKGETERGIELLETFIRENPGSVLGYRELVNLYQNVKKYEQSIEHVLALADLCLENEDF